MDMRLIFTWIASDTLKERLLDIPHLKPVYTLFLRIKIHPNSDYRLALPNEWLRITFCFYLNQGFVCRLIRLKFNDVDGVVGHMIWTAKL